MLDVGYMRPRVLYEHFQCSIHLVSPHLTGLELRQIQRLTDFELRDLYELYGHFFRFAQTPNGDKDREITASAPNNFVRGEFQAMLTKCGIDREEVSNRIFDQYAHPVGFGRKKRVLLPFRAATLALCAFGISTRMRQALSLLQIMDEVTIESSNGECAKGV